jgi:Ser/Thr protein kinase RdoA (MazF antagonist)
VATDEAGLADADGSVASQHTLDDLLAWAEDLIGSSFTMHDRSASLESSLILELVAPNGDDRWFLKYPRDRERFEREAYAYETFLPALGDRVPRLIGSSERYQCLLITAVPGEVVDRRLSLDPQVHRSAGAWLADFHGSCAPESVPERSLAEELAAQREVLIEKARGSLGPAEVGFLRRATTGIPDPVESIIVPCHRSFAPRNWVVDEQGTLRVIDFGVSERDFAVQDFSRLSQRIWPANPGLEDAFFEGYGRPLTDAERRQVQAFAALWVIRAMIRAQSRGDKPALARARRSLGRIDSKATGR